MPCSPSVHPIASGGVRCVAADKRLEELEPRAYGFLVNFVKDSELRTREGRVAGRTELARLRRAGDAR